MWRRLKEIVQEALVKEIRSIKKKKQKELLDLKKKWNWTSKNGEV